MSTALEYLLSNPPIKAITPDSGHLLQDTTYTFIPYLNNLSIIFVIVLLLILLGIKFLARTESIAYIQKYLVSKTINTVIYTLILFLILNQLPLLTIKDHPIIKGIIAAILSIFITLAYNNYLTGLSSRICENIKKNLYPANSLLDKINNLKKYINLLIETKFIDRKDQVMIVDQIFDDISGLFSEKKHLMRYAAYMQLLSSFAKEYQVLHGLNKTLPIFWFAPMERKQKSTLEYENVLIAHKKRGLKVNRVTAINDIKVLRNQFGHALKMMQAKHESNYKMVWWFLTLLQNLHEAGGRVACIVFSVSKLFESYSEIAYDTIIKGRNIDEELMLGIPGEDKQRIVASVINFINTYSSQKEFLEHINSITLTAFYNKHGEEGSYYLQSHLLEHHYNAIINDPQFDDIGEICVYSNSNVKPLAAMVTLGELGEYVCVKLVNEEKMHGLMINLIKDTSSFHPDNGGNIKVLI